MNFKFIYKILAKIEWVVIKDKSEFKGTKKDLEDGYIHFSEEEQVRGTLKKFYKNQNILYINSQKDTRSLGGFGCLKSHKLGHTTSHEGKSEQFIKVSFINRQMNKTF